MNGLPAVHYGTEDGVAVVTLDDGKANALSLAVVAALDEAVTRAEEEADALLLVGRPGCFSAGFDLATMRAGDEEREALIERGVALFRRLFLLELPVVAACTGHALAAGAVLLLVADKRLGAEGPFKLGLNEVAIGFSLTAATLTLARYRMPPSAFDAVLLGEVCGPAEAVRRGFLDVTLPPEQVVDEASALAHELASLDRTALGQTKRRARLPVVREGEASTD